MKVATVKYTGRVRNQSHRAPSGQRYGFGGTREASVEELSDAEYFENKGSYEVEYTSAGKLMSLVSGDLEDIEEAISDIDYNVKRSMASQMGLDPESRSESALEEALVDHADTLRQQMENQ